jgi:DNA (cytosine-5)-methyltransferase 1
VNELALFAGAGGGILGGHLLGWRTVCAVEFDAYAASILVARQNDGCLAPFPVWDDVRTFDGRPWRGRVDVVSGGFPCQDISAAGGGAGISGSRSGLWSEFARIIGEVRPGYVFVENSPMLASRGLGQVLGDLAALGFDAEWGVLGAADVGAPHQRDRIWIVAAYADGDRVRLEEQRQAWGRIELQDGWRTVAVDDGAQEPLGDTEEGGRGARRERGSADAGTGYPEPVGPLSDATVVGLEGSEPVRRQLGFGERAGDAGWWATEPDVGRVAHGVADRVDRIRAIGNGQVPAVAALAWRLLMERMQ